MAPEVIFCKEKKCVEKEKNTPEKVIFQITDSLSPTIIYLEIYICDAYLWNIYYVSGILLNLGNPKKSKCNSRRTSMDTQSSGGQRSINSVIRLGECSTATLRGTQPGLVGSGEACWRR